MAQFEGFINILLDGSKDIEVSGNGNGFQNNEHTVYTTSCGKQAGTAWGITAEEWEKIYFKIYKKKDCLTPDWIKNNTKREWAIDYHFRPDVWEKCGFSRIKSQYVANILADVYTQSFTKSFLNARVALNKMGEKFSENSSMINSALVDAINRQTDLDEDLLIKLLKEERGKQGKGSRINKYPNRPGATNVYGTCKVKKSKSLIVQKLEYETGQTIDDEEDCTTDEAREHAEKHGAKSNFIKNYFSRVKGGFDFSTSLWKQDIGYSLSFIAIVLVLGKVLFFRKKG